MNKIDVIRALLKEKIAYRPILTDASAFAPSNIALCKYWGKRNAELNLPMTSSLSIGLGDKGATATLSLIEGGDRIVLNDQPMALTSSFGQRLVAFLDLFRQATKQSWSLNVVIHSRIPIAAGLASSACGFASLVRALNQLFQWNLSSRELSILARLGSGSACRSLWQGFVEWHAGCAEDGMDSYGEPLAVEWPGFCIGLCIVQSGPKTLSSREAMQRTIDTSPFYEKWPAVVAHDYAALKSAILSQDFDALGKTAESNALAMHAMMQTAWPPIVYALPDTLVAMQTVWRLREMGISVYFTQDAGPNLKLLFLQNDRAIIQSHMPMLEYLQIF